MLRLLRTTSIRFTLIYVVVFSSVVGMLGFYLYRATSVFESQQTDATIDRDMSALADLFATENGPRKLVQAVRAQSVFQGDGLYMLLTAPSGAVLAGNLTALPPEALSADENFFSFTYERPVPGQGDGEGQVEIREGRGKILRFSEAQGAETSFLVFVARDISDRRNLQKRSQGVIVRITLATIALGLVIGLLFSQSLLRRVDSVNKTAKAIRGGDLSQRIALTGGGDELESLAINLNTMLDQIERLMTGMREVSDNIAHDLRSPLTRIHNRLSNALEADAPDKVEIMRATLADSDRMLATFNALLSIARIESGEGAGVMEAIDLAAIAEEMAELYEPATQDAGFGLTLTTRPAPPIKGSRTLISQAIANLFDNALKYAEGGTQIEISVNRTAKGTVVLSVADDGPGIPEGDRSNVLRRFVRLETSRTSPGSGLGLSLVSAVARAHGAKLKLSGATEDGTGLRVSLYFPPFDRS